MNLKQFKTKKFLNKGTTGKCFLLKDGTVFKKFNSPLDLSELERFKYFLNYKNDNFLFPFDFIYDNKKFYGYITKRALGDTLQKTFKNSDLEKLSINCIKLEKNIDLISEGKIIMYDYHSENVMYDGNLIQVIDSDDYGITDFYTEDAVKERNYEYNRIMMCNLCLTNIKLNKHTDYITDRIIRYKHSDVKVSEILVNIKEDIEKHYKENISTINDFNNIIRESESNGKSIVYSRTYRGR